MTLDVVLLPGELQPRHITGRTVVVFDVLRATTTMTAALAAGVKAIHICPDTASARRYAASAGLDPAPLLCGEEQCLRPDGFDLGNSPGGFTRQYAGREVVMSTTNGTRAILAAAGARLLLVGALVNATAAARAVADAGHDVTLLCAGTNGQVAMEDLIGAGAVRAALGPTAHVGDESDTARIALRLFTSATPNFREALADGAGGRNVIAAGLAQDIDFAAAIDRFKDVVGVVDGQTVRGHLDGRALSSDC
jgi:2-phosphosulfolactate phosphatase